MLKGRRTALKPSSLKRRIWLTKSAFSQTAHVTIHVSSFPDLRLTAASWKATNLGSGR